MQLWAELDAAGVGLAVLANLMAVISPFVLMLCTICFVVPGCLPVDRP